MFEKLSVKIDGGYDCDFPELVPVEQYFAGQALAQIEKTIDEELGKKGILDQIKPGQRIAVAVGSRGIDNLRTIVRHVIENIKRQGGYPFIVPAMGSHGGADPEGQREILKAYGISEDTMAVPVLSGMEVVELGTFEAGVPVYIDKHAFEADGIVIINRVKAHTDFKAAFESGLMKMLVIGLGNHRGATAVHAMGFDRFHRLIPEIGKVILAKAKVLFGVAIIENAENKTARIEAVAAKDFAWREPQLLLEAKNLMPRIIPRGFDVLVVEEIGKDISGSGMDPNVVGRHGSGLPGFDGPSYQRLVVFDLTEKSHGNACGIGMADVTTRDLVNKINFNDLYANCITAANLNPARIPVVMKSEQEALAVAIKTCYRVTVPEARIVFIKNTLSLKKILVSQPLWEEIKTNPDVKQIGPSQPMIFDKAGRLLLRPSQL
ncbi:MAG TPA: DUF2088 domain-containing protein [Clostridia bacterium]|nr:DUF2088 domain-containing protein [Clostridia bacterium]